MIKTNILPIQETFIDYPDNHSIALIIYFSGCKWNCKGCHSSTLQLPYQGEEYRLDMFQRLINRSDYKKIVFSGGDPLYGTNVDFVREFLIRNKKVDVCIYTGHSIQDVKDLDIKGFKYIKCNPFDINNKQESFKTDTMMQFASSNQELYDKNFNLISNNGIYYFKEEE